MGVRSYLALTFLSSAFILRFFFSDLYLIYQVGADFPWFITIRLEYCSIPLIVLSASIFLHAIYPIEFGKNHTLFFNYLSGLALITVLLMPTGMLTETLIGLQIIGLAFALTIFVSIYRAVYRQRSGAWLSASSVACFAAVGIYNIYALLFSMDLNRLMVLGGYTAALILSVISLTRRTPIRLKEEHLDMLRYEDFYNKP
jgi:hypothetical protein